MEREMINVAPMIPGHEREIAADLLDMYQRGVIQATLFSCALVPEGTPVSDKAARLAELFQKQRAALGDSPLPVGILLQAMIGHGWVPSEQAPYQRFTYADGTVPYMFCPLDQDFIAYIRRSVRMLARLKPDFFMVDDDTRMHSGRGGCYCPLHMAEFNRRRHANYQPPELYEALLANEELAQTWDDFQQEALIGMATLIRAEFDAVDPAIRGMFCTCNGDIRHAPDMARRLAAVGQRPTLRINNPMYLYMHEKPHEMIAWMLKTAIQKAHAPDDYCILAETDTCCHNRYFTSAATIHALYAWSLLNGCTGGKLWITDMTDYTPGNGKAYRDKLAKYSGFYDEVFAMKPEWQGVVAPLLPYPHFNAARFPWGKTNYRSWNTECFGFLGLPHAYAKTPPPNTVIALSESEVSFATDDELRRFFAQKVLLDGAAARALTERGLAALMGVKAEPWDLAEATLERTADGVTMQRALAGARLTPLPGAETRSTLYHAPFRHSAESVALAPGSVKFTNELGGTVFTMAGDLVDYWFAIAAVLNPRRKEFLRKELGLQIYYAGDAPLALHTFMDRGVQTICAFNLGLDVLAELPLAGLPNDVKLAKLFPDGSWRAVRYENNVVEAAMTPLELLFLRAC